MGPAVGALIGLSSLDWAWPAVVPTRPRDHERHLRAELGPDFAARLFPSESAVGSSERANQDCVSEAGLLRRLARAVASVL